MKKILILISVLFLITLTSCGQIADTNGEDDYSLTTFEDYNFYVSSSNCITKKYLSKTKNNITTITVEKMSGIQTIKTLNPKGKTINIEVSMTTYSGNARLVLVIDQKIVYDFEVNGTSTYTIKNINSKCFFKVGCESANFELIYKIS